MAYTEEQYQTFCNTIEENLKKGYRNNFTPSTESPNFCLNSDGCLQCIFNYSMPNNSSEMCSRWIRENEKPENTVTITMYGVGVPEDEQIRYRRQEFEHSSNIQFFVDPVNNTDYLVQTLKEIDETKGKRVIIVGAGEPLKEIPKMERVISVTDSYKEKVKERVTKLTVNRTSL